MRDTCLPHSVIVRLIKLAHKLEDAAERLFFAPYGLTMFTGRIVMILGHLGKATSAELIAMTECTKSNLSQRLMTLEKAGLITHQKRPTTGDKRHTSVTLTPKGRLQANALMKVFDSQIAHFEKAVPAKDWDCALKVLEVINEKIDSSFSPLS